MNSPQGKSVLALVRDAPYAHAGEAEAIDLALASFPKDPSRRLLDAGCGLGGTADYVSRAGWGHVTGFDIDAVSIARARELYPACAFEALDVAAAGDRWPGAFDVIYSFNAVYAFPDQAAALRSLGRAARPGAALVIFDYTDPASTFDQSDFCRQEDVASWRPLHPPTLTSWADAAGWEPERTVDLTAEYRRWYAGLVARIEAREPAVTAAHGAAVHAFVRSFYGHLLESIEQGRMGGALFEFRKR